MEIVSNYYFVRYIYLLLVVDKIKCKGKAVLVPVTMSWIHRMLEEKFKNSYLTLVVNGSEWLYPGTDCRAERIQIIKYFLDRTMGGAQSLCGRTVK